MKVFNKGKVYDKSLNKEYLLSGVVYDRGFRGGNGLVLCVDEEEGYAAIQEVETTSKPYNSLEMTTVKVVAFLDDYEYFEE